MSVTRRRLDLDARAELEEQRDFLLRSLDDLDRERSAGDIDEADYRELRDDYTRRAAEVVRAIDEDREVQLAARPPARRGRTVLAAGAVVVLAVVAGVTVAGSAGSRLPGDTITGDIRQTTPGRLREAAELASTGQFTEALEAYDAVLADDPENVEALSERGLLLVSLAQATGRTALAQEGRRSIEAALEVSPEHARSLFYLGLALRLEGDDAASDAAIERALAADPAPTLRRQIEQFRQSVAEAAPDPEPGAGAGSS